MPNLDGMFEAPVTQFVAPYGEKRPGTFLLPLDLKETADKMELSAEVLVGLGGQVAVYARWLVDDEEDERMALCENALGVPEATLAKLVRSMQQREAQDHGNG